MTDLLPCPFCGCRDAKGTVKIKCPQCGASSGYEQSEMDAANKWNRRVGFKAEQPPLEYDRTYMADITPQQRGILNDMIPNIYGKAEQGE